MSKQLINAEHRPGKSGSADCYICVTKQLTARTSANAAADKTRPDEREGNKPLDWKLETARRTLTFRSRPHSKSQSAPLHLNNFDMPTLTCVPHAGHFLVV